MIQKDEDIVNDVLKNFERLSGDRGTWESHWEEIAERILPEHRNTLRLGSYNTPGARKTELQFDSTAAIALSRFTAIMTSILTPDNWIWHRLKTNNRELNSIREVRVYFEEVNRILWDERRRPSANFAGQNSQVNQSLGAYGTGGLFIDENLDAGGIRYKYAHLGRNYIEENHQGIVNRNTRWELYKGYQLLENKLWRDRLPKEVLEKCAKNPNQPYTVIHRVCPRGAEYEPGRYDARGMPYSSYYVLKETKTLLQAGGYTTFPYTWGRYEQVMDESYGRSPAMAVLPSIKTLNEMKKTVLKQGHRVLDPAIFTHDDGVVDGWSIEPGAINSGGVNKDGRPLFATLPTGNLAVTHELMDAERAPINDVFLVSLFQILTENPQMTATEVLERSREKGILLAPSAGRQQSERLGPQIGRELDILARQRKLPPMPRALIEAKGEYDVEYDNDLTRAARAQEAAAFSRSLETAMTVVQATGDTSPLDHFDFDAAIPEIAQIQGTPERWITDVAEVADKRIKRAKQMQAQQAVQAAPAAAAMIKAQAVSQKAQAA